MPVEVDYGTRIGPWAARLATRFSQPIRMPRQQADGRIEIDHWTAIADGRHNLTTDLTWWRDRYLLVHAASPWHLASADSRIVLHASHDARTWHRLATLQLAGCDIRDPKLAVVGDREPGFTPGEQRRRRAARFDRLVLYALRNDRLVAEPRDTVVAISDDGEHWSPWRPCGPAGWLLWRPKRARDGRWYVPAYWHEHGRAILLASDDCLAWSQVSLIHEGDRNDETDLAFLPDGRAVVTARLEITDSPLGNAGACTLVATAEPPYQRWRTARSSATRLDGPNLFTYRDEVYAVGRRHRRARGRINRFGGFLGRKRTAVYRVGDSSLTHLTDLPSSGDTGYPGIVLDGDQLTICYYTNDVHRDPSWLFGMFLPSEIRIARLSMAKLAALRQTAPERRILDAEPPT